MKPLKQTFYLLLIIFGIFLVPFIGAWLQFGGRFPTDYFAYPPVSASPKAPFSPFVFWGVIGCSVVVILLYVFPRLFGFKPVAVPPSEPTPAVALPVWFWVGLVAWGGTLFVLWGKFSEPRWLLEWAFLPLFWGYTLMLDGWVYVRANRHSLISKSPQELIGIGVAASSGWLLFDYLNFFVDENWFYPSGGLVPDDQFTIYAVVGATGLMPAIFEFYNLMNTFPAFRHRYDNGPRLSMPRRARTVLMLVGFFGMFSIGFFPDALFAILWLSPMFILAFALENLGIWTPFTPLKNGNWSPLLKYTLTYLLFGISLECFNHFSSYPDPLNPEITLSFTPAYWKYSIPYVNAYHIFEMPLAGYFGYLPFGIYCAVWWISFSFLLNIPTQFAQDEYGQVETLEPLVSDRKP